MKSCSITDCSKPHCAKGYCKMHWARVRRHGTPHFNGSLRPNSTNKNTGRYRANKLFSLAKKCEICGARATERHHKDGNPTHNTPENIIHICHKCHCHEHWKDPVWAEKKRGQIRNGWHYHHQKCKKLTEEQVRKIPDMRASGLTQKQIGNLFGVRKEAIRLVCIGERWSHLGLVFTSNRRYLPRAKPLALWKE